MKKLSPEKSGKIMAESIISYLILIPACFMTALIAEGFIGDIGIFYSMILLAGLIILISNV